MRYKWVRICLEGDGGAGAGGAGGAGAGTGTGAGAGTGDGGAGGAPAGAETMPKYFSQFSPEHRASQAYKDNLKGFAKLDDLADAYINMKGENETIKKTYLKKLTKDSTDEEVKAWAQEMGIPDKADAYRFGDEKDTDPPEMKGAVKAWKDIAWKNGMSAKQAEAAWAYVKGLSAVGQARQARALDEAKNALPAKLADLYKGESASAKDAQDKASAAAGLFAKFATATGAGAQLEASGMAYDPAFVKAVASIMRTQGGDLGGSPGAGAPKGYGAFGSSYAESSKRVLGIH